jgi:hypothetical protein
MARKLLIGLALLVSFACNTIDESDIIKRANGTLWLSSGLMHCAQQIHLDMGDTLVVTMEDIFPLIAGDRVDVSYKELGANASCPSFVTCEIVEIKKMD